MVLDSIYTYDLVSSANQNTNLADYDAIKISIASPEKIRSWSYGEVTKPDTVNYRTFKPEKDGLFCAKIFGPIKDYECLCGKYKRIKYKGIICEKCGVEVTSSKVRRERMGHIDLVCPVAHIWFLKSLPSKISTILGAKLKDIERVIYFESYIVTEVKAVADTGDLYEGQILTETLYDECKEKYGDSFKAETGAAVVRKLLERIDLEKLRGELTKKLKGEFKEEGKDVKKSSGDKKNILKQLKIVNDFIKSGTRPEWMIFTVLPVIPPGLRPLVQLDAGTVAASDLNELYRRVINRNNRLKRFMEKDAPEFMIRTEQKMLQEAVDALLDNGRNGNVVSTGNKRPFKSLSDSMKGKTGRFRQNLLGKRVDYSGRSVIVVGPSLKINECGIPKKIALELFRPFVYSKLELYGLSSSIRQSKKMVDLEYGEVYDVLEEVIREHPVLLNRAPTLHRLSVQAFNPVLIEGKAIQMHPLVCKAFNADFDGDQMSVHVPLSIEAQIEAKVLMMSTSNILHPKDGKATIMPEEDMMFGAYYLTLQSSRLEKNPYILSDVNEMEAALFSKLITINDIVLYKFEVLSQNGEKIIRKEKTTPGRIKLFNVTPDVCRKEEILSLINKPLFKNDVKILLDYIYRNSTQTDTCIFSDKFMDLAFEVATKSGLSVGKDDMLIPESKKEIVEAAQKNVDKIEKQFESGLITNGERYNKIIDIWSKCSDEITKEMVKKMDCDREPSSRNSIYMMAECGARGSKSQLQQLCSMRGLMTKASGAIIETPIITNLKEGLNVSEFFISANLTRKGYVDIALKTANAGYLTRKLVGVAQDVVVTMDDCGTKNGILLEEKVENGKIIMPLYERVLGRTLSKDLIDPNTNEVLIEANTLIDEKLSKIFKEKDIKQIEVRSALTCECKDGICAKCYGRDLTTGILVSEGEAVGVVAAQAIGEPGTQLTMNSKHNAAGGGVIESSIVSPASGTASIKNYSVVKNRNGDNIVLSRNYKILIQGENGNVLFTYNIPFGSKVFHKDGDKIGKNDLIAEWDPYNIPVITTKSGKVKYKDLFIDMSLEERFDEEANISTKIVIDWKRQEQKLKLKPSIVVADTEYELVIDAILNVNDNDEVLEGDVVAKVPRESIRNKDITGGLPKVARLFELSGFSKNLYSIIASVDGVVDVNAEKTKYRITIKPTDGSESVVYVIPKSKYLFVSTGDFVHKGDILIDGMPIPHDILKVLGISAFAKHMVTEIQKIYEGQGINVADKHIEIILSKLLQKIEVIDSGETTLYEGDVLDRDEFEKVNKEAEAEGLKPARASSVLLGLTKASLQTKSFIAAASFQETTKVLTNASIQGKVDSLKGLKENIVLGRLIPAGTGLLFDRIKSKLKKEAS
ncbi:MAG: DNA-directed RNA polymerase subunit beta' [Rickettsiales bacterium]|jgi:DNA-directed RNA polymerase subunit beta'|nr:DNA-directed RNA polymerase subunit beta' [Rickettsiales bacterium]